MQTPQCIICEIDEIYWTIHILFEVLVLSQIKTLENVKKKKFKSHAMKKKIAQPTSKFWVGVGANKENPIGVPYSSFLRVIIDSLFQKEFNRYWNGEYITFLISN